MFQVKIENIGTLLEVGELKEEELLHNYEVWAKIRKAAYWLTNKLNICSTN